MANAESTCATSLGGSCDSSLCTLNDEDAVHAYLDCLEGSGGCDPDACADALEGVTTECLSNVD